MERQPGGQEEPAFDPDNSETWDPVLENIVGKGLQSQIFGAIAVLDRPVSKQEFRKLTADFGSEQQQDEVLRALTAKGMIQENPDGTFQAGTTPESKALIDEVKTGAGWENTRWRAGKLLLGRD